MRSVFVVSLVLALALLVVGCGASAASTTTTAPAAAVTTAPPTTTTTMPTLTEPPTTTLTEPPTTTLTEPPTTTTTAPPTTTTTEPPTATTAESNAAYKAKCTTLNYEVLDKNPDAHVGEFLKFKGKIFRMGEIVEATWMLVDVTYGSLDTSNVYVEYGRGTVDLHEGDIINVWGESAGSYTYPSANHEITVPALQAKYIETVK